MLVQTVIPISGRCEYSISCSLNCNEAHLLSKASANLLCIIKVSFIMSYTYNGTEIRVEQPIRSISVNKSKVIFADGTGRKITQFANGGEARQFLSWLTSAH